MPLVLAKGARVGFEHDELDWMEGTIVRPSFNGEEWLVRTPLGGRWVRLADLRPPRPPAPVPPVPSAPS